MQTLYTPKNCRNKGSSGERIIKSNQLLFGGFSVIAINCNYEVKFHHIMSIMPSENMLEPDYLNLRRLLVIKDSAIDSKNLIASKIDTDVITLLSDI